MEESVSLLLPAVFWKPDLQLYVQPPAVRILPTLLEVRMLERMEAAGRSPTRELLWSWAQQRPRVRDLLRVLQDMGHQRALQLIQDHIHNQSPVIKGKCIQTLITIATYVMFYMESVNELVVGHHPLQQITAQIYIEIMKTCVSALLIGVLITQLRVRTSIILRVW